MNEDFRDLLQAEKYPEIRISIDKIQLISKQYAKIYMSVNLTGQRNEYELPVKIDKNRYQGKILINIQDFGLDPPKKALGLIKVREGIEIYFDLIIEE